MDSVALNVQCRCDFVNDLREPPRNIFREKPQYQITVFLKQEIFAAVAPIVLRISEMESAVNLYGKLPLLAEKIHFHKWIGAERNINTPIECKQTFRLGKPVEELDNKDKK